MNETTEAELNFARNALAINASVSEHIDNIYANPINTSIESAELLVIPEIIDSGKKYQ